jgi:hypothetical protein
MQVMIQQAGADRAMTAKGIPRRSRYLPTTFEIDGRSPIGRRAAAAAAP